MEKFIAKQIGIKAVFAIRPVMTIIKRHDPDLYRQAKRAMNSAILNVVEGNRRTGKDRLHLFSVSIGSADEVITALELACAWGYVSCEDIENSVSLLSRFIGTTRNLMKCKY